MRQEICAWCENYIEPHLRGEFSEEDNTFCSQECKDEFTKERLSLLTRRIATSLSSLNDYKKIKGYKNNERKDYD